MTKIYTKKGDKGKTIICGMEVAKNHPRLVVLGALDELNSSLGMVLAGSADLESLKEIQKDLLDIGAALSEMKEVVGSRLEIKVQEMEKEIDKIWEELPSLQNFILPGGGEVGSRLHFTRSVCRRAERELAFLSEREKVPPQIIIYLNRLSDYLFALARLVNKKEGVNEVIWS